MVKSDHSGPSAKKSATSTTIAVILTAIIVGSVVGGATSYLFMSRTDSTLQEVRSDVRAVADAAGIPINNPDQLKKLMEERNLIKAAKQEGKVVIYFNTGAAGLPELRSAFERKYPQITVEFVTDTATDITNRFLSEHEKSVKGADVIGLGQAALFDILEKPESLAKYVPKDTGWLAAELKDKDGRWASQSTAMFGITYNTKLVPKAEAPKNFQDLLDPKWSGKIGATDPKTAPAAAAAWKTMEKQYGEDYVRKLAAQKIKYYGTELLDKLVAGEVSINLLGLVGTAESRRIAGQPVDWVRISDNTYLAQLAWAGMSANAPHPNAAKLWIDFLFSKEGQQTFANAGVTPNMPDIRLSSPDIAIQGKKLIPSERVTSAERDAFLKSFSAKYNLSFP